MRRVFIHVTEHGTNADQVDIDEAANLLADARQVGKAVTNHHVQKAKSDIERVSSGVVFQLVGSSAEETCPTLIVMDIY